MNATLTGNELQGECVALLHTLANAYVHPLASETDEQFTEREDLYTALTVAIRDGIDASDSILAEYRAEAKRVAGHELLRYAFSVSIATDYHVNFCDGSTGALYDFLRDLDLGALELVVTGHRKLSDLPLRDVLTAAGVAFGALYALVELACKYRDTDPFVTEEVLASAERTAIFTPGIVRGELLGRISALRWTLRTPMRETPESEWVVAVAQVFASFLLLLTHDARERFA